VKYKSKCWEVCGECEVAVLWSLLNWTHMLLIVNKEMGLKIQACVPKFHTSEVYGAWARRALVIVIRSAYSLLVARQIHSDEVNMMPNQEFKSVSEDKQGI